jgi:4-amino-4-deoxy-L-arabinose transferase-like glycosyltransferase
MRDATKNINDMRHLLLILGIAFLARFLWAAFVPVIPVSDSYDYHTFALNLVQHGVYGWNPKEPTAYWPPGTSAAYALIYSIFGAGQWAIKCFNLALGILIVFLTVELATRWFNQVVAIIAGLLVGLWPVLIEFTTIIASEMLFTAVLLSVLLLFDEICSREKDFRFLAIGLGALIGFASLLRSPALLLPALLALVFYVQKRTIIPSLKLISITTVLMLIVILPWSARNYALFGEPVVISTSGGVNLWIGNNPTVAGLSGSYRDPPAWRPGESHNPTETGIYQEPSDLYPGMNEAQIDRFLGKEAIAYIMQAPATFMIRTVVRAFRFYERETIGVWWNGRGVDRDGQGGVAIKVASQAFWMGALLLFGIGCYFSCRQGFASFAFNPGIATLLYFNLIYAPFFVNDRFHIPTDPIMAIFAGYAISRIAPIVRSRFWPFGPVQPPQGETIVREVDSRQKRI